MALYAYSEVFKLRAIILDCWHFAGGHHGHHCGLLRELRVEVAHVRDILRESWPHRRLNAPVKNLLVVQLSEPRMCKHLLEASLGAEAIRRGLLQQLCDEVFAVFGHRDVVALWVWEVDRLLLDQLVHFRVILRARVERREPYNHLVSQNSERPPVHGERMPTLDQNFGRQIVRRSAEGECLSISFQHLCKSEVSEANIPVLVHQNVLRL